MARWLHKLIYSPVEDWGVLSAVEDWVTCLHIGSITLLSALDLIHVSKCGLILQSHRLWKASLRLSLQGRCWDTKRLFHRQKANAGFSVQFLCLPYLSLSLKPLIPCAILSCQAYTWCSWKLCFVRNKIHPRKHIPYYISHVEIHWHVYHSVGL